MSQVLVTEDYLEDIADAIRAKNGLLAQYKPGQMAAAITAIPGQSTLTTKNITANGTYAASSDNADGYSSVTVAVQPSGFAFIHALYNSGDMVTASDGTTTLTGDSSGEYYFLVPNSGTWTVTAGSDSVSLSVTEKGGTYNADTRTVTIVPWSTGTDEQIVAMIEAAHAGRIDLHDDGGWNVGDVRSITVGAFTGGGNTSHAQQTIDIVISSFADYNSCGCVMQFDFKDELAQGDRMNSSVTNVGGYGQSEMKTSTLPALVNALPSWLKGLLIEFSVLASAGSQSSTIDTVTGNKLALRSEVEIFGSTTYAKTGEGSQIPYYTTAANRIKKLGHSGSAYGWWERSPYGSSSNYFCYVGGTGAASYTSHNAIGVAPFGCI